MMLGKIHISVLLLGPMLAGAGTAGVAWATLGGRVSAVETAHAETRARVEKIEPDLAQNKLDIAVVKTNTETMMKSLDRLEDRLGTKER